jgi:peptidoglycan/xylan/chitin deacetylase (PgdA/CDA1 family)
MCPVMNAAAISGLSAAAAGGLTFYGAMHPRAQIFGRTVHRTRDRKAIALTFDDGPNPTVTPALLDLLDRYSCHATFFLIGGFVRQCPVLAREISARGNALGNHTDSHPNLFWLPPRRIRQELERCQQAIGEATGAQVQWMRPPYGIRGPQLASVVRRAGLHDPVLWSVSAHDWIAQPQPRLVRRLRAVTGGDIVLMHDGDHRRLGGERDATLRALAYWLPRWHDAGLECATLDQLVPHARVGEAGKVRG